MRRFFMAFISFGLSTAISACAGGFTRTATSPSAGPSVADVVDSGDGARLGAGWYPVESIGGDVFRWTSNDAEIMACPDATHHTLAMEVEPGPGLGTRVMTLKIRSTSRTEQDVYLKDRRVINVVVVGNEPQTLTFHVLSKNKHVPHDARVLNFRIFHARLGSHLSNCADTILRNGSPLEIGANWYSYETFAGESFRWVNNDAEVKVERALPKGSVIEVEAEPGPSLGGEKLALSLTENGKTIATASPTDNRTFVQLKTNAAVAAGQTLKLHVNSPNKEAPGDPRTLNFRVFDVGLRSVTQ
jgi:hypothetical protein